MKDKESQATKQNDQPAESEQQTPAETIPKPVFIKRGPGMPFDEFKKVCIQRLIDAGLIKEGSRPQKAGSGSPSNEQTLPDGHPFKGTQILFGMRPTKSSEKSSPKEEPPAKNGVFMMKGEGQNFEEFVEACVQSFKDNGLIKPE